MIFDRKGKTDEKLIEIYHRLLYPRLIEEKMLLMLRQGQIGKWFSGIGQEAISVGSTLAMLPEEYILPMHRNLGVFTTRGVPLKKLVAQWQGKATGFTQGRDRSFHFGSQEHKIIGMISHLGPQMAVADGIALADVLADKKQATLVFTGEGATSQGDFHESINVAAVWNLPVIFLIENNGFALSTPVEEQFKCTHLSEKAIGYGIEGLRIDGNNVLEVFDTIHAAAIEIRSRPRPILIECTTFRMRGHEEASGTSYVPKTLLDQWRQKDPLSCFESFLLEQGVLHRSDLPEIRTVYKQEIDQQILSAMEEPEPQTLLSKELADMYFPYSPGRENPGNGKVKNLRFLDALNEGLNEGLLHHKNLVLMGQDIAEYGGAFKVTEGLHASFGKERIRNTPLCESAIVGAGLGLSINGFKSIIEMQFADFASCGFNQIVNNLAKTHYRWGQKADVVIRMPTGAGTGAGPFHSQSNEAWFTKTPGLKVLYPAFPDDAKGLLLSAIDDPNPVLFFEHKYLYRSLKGTVPEGYFRTPIGKARVISKGRQLSVITYGMGVHWAQSYFDVHPELSVMLVDLRSLQPWDKETVEWAAKATGRVLILHEDTLTCGFGAELAAWIGEHCFHFLDAPVMRCASADTAIPMNKNLEQDFLAKSRIPEMVSRLLAY